MIRYEISIHLDGDPVTSGNATGVTVEHGHVRIENTEAKTTLHIAPGFWAQVSTEEV